MCEIANDAAWPGSPKRTRRGDGRGGCCFHVAGRHCCYQYPPPARRAQSIRNASAVCSPIWTASDGARDSRNDDVCWIVRPVCDHDGLDPQTTVTRMMRPRMQAHRCLCLCLCDRGRGCCDACCCYPCPMWLSIDACCSCVLLLQRHVATSIDVCYGCGCVSGGCGCGC